MEKFKVNCSPSLDDYDVLSLEYSTIRLVIVHETLHKYIMNKQKSSFGVPAKAKTPKTTYIIYAQVKGVSYGDSIKCRISYGKEFNGLL